MEEEEPPPLFLCPISMELMEDPVTVSTGVTYDRRSIERWLFTYRRSTCPATMQRLRAFDLTPNHTLKRLISSWLHRASTSKPAAPPPLPPLCHVLAGLEATPFKVTALKNLRSCMSAAGDAEAMHREFVAAGGVQVLGRVMAQALAESGGGEFAAFRTCEEAAAVLVALPLSDEPSVGLLLRPECMRPVMALLQRGSAEARLNAMAVLGKVSRAGGDWVTAAGGDVDADILKSLLELLSDEVSPKLSSRALDVLLDVVARSKGGRAKAVEAGDVCVLVELLPDADRHAAERILLLLRRLCERPEGRLAFAEHEMAVAAVSKTVLRVSEAATKLAVKVLWLVCGMLPTEKVLDDMMATGAVAKLLGLLHVGGSPETKGKVVRMVRAHGGFWRKYPCFPSELGDYLRLLN